jgi:hypothetical protein
LGIGYCFAATANAATMLLLDHCKTISNNQWKKCRIPLVISASLKIVHLTAGRAKKSGRSE